MILAGDIGGTKTNLGVFGIKDGSLHSFLQRSYPSKDFVGLEIIVEKFLADVSEPITAASFGVAGPVIEGVSVTPNLAWDVSAQSLAQSLKLESVTLLNDLEATAYGVFELRPKDLVTLNEGVEAQGNAALIAAGTGLGMASLFWDGRAFVPSASEGGHMEFAPRDDREIGLLRYLLDTYAHVSIERVLSGPGLFNIYSYLRDAGYARESSEVAGRFAAEDPSRVIASAAVGGGDELCAKALDMFASIYGATAGNMALFLKATGGVYVGGGIAPKIIEKLKDGSFIKAYMDKGRVSSLVAAMPVRVIMNDKTALLGAAAVAARRTS